MIALLLLCLRIDKGATGKWPVVVQHLCQKDSSLYTEQDVLNMYPMLKNIRKKMDVLLQMKANITRSSGGPVSDGSKEATFAIIRHQTQVEVLENECEKLLDEFIRINCPMLFQTP